MGEFVLEVLGLAGTVRKWLVALQAASERANDNAGRKCVRGVVPPDRLLKSNPWHRFTRLSRGRAPLLRLRPRGLHDVPHGIRRGLLLQGPRRLPVVQRQAHGPDGGASRRSCHPTGARAAVGDLRAEAAAGHAGRPTPSRRRTQRSYRRGQSPRPIWPRLQSGCAAA